MDLLEPSEKRTRCPYKGDASYWSVRAGGKVAGTRVGLSRADRRGTSARGLLAFYWHSMDEWLEEDEVGDRARARPLPPGRRAAHLAPRPRVGERRGARRVTAPAGDLFETGLPPAGTSRARTCDWTCSRRATRAPDAPTRASPPTGRSATRTTWCGRIPDPLREAGADPGPPGVLQRARRHRGGRRAAGTAGDAVVPRARARRSLLSAGRTGRPEQVLRVDAQQDSPRAQARAGGEWWRTPPRSGRGSGASASRTHAVRDPGALEQGTGVRQARPAGPACGRAAGGQRRPPARGDLRGAPPPCAGAARRASRRPPGVVRPGGSATSAAKVPRDTGARRPWTATVAPARDGAATTTERDRTVSRRRRRATTARGSRPGALRRPPVRSPAAWRPRCAPRRVGLARAGAGTANWRRTGARRAARRAACRRGSSRRPRAPARRRPRAPRRARPLARVVRAQLEAP